MAEDVKDRIKVITGVFITIGLFFAGYTFDNMSEQLDDVSGEVKKISETVTELKTSMHYISKDQDAMKLEMQVIKGEHNAIIRQTQRD